MSHIVGTILSLAGFIALCLAMPRHQRDLLGRALSEGGVCALRLTGFCLLGLSFLQATWSLGWAYGVISWLGYMSLAAWILILLISWRTQRA